MFDQVTNPNDPRQLSLQRAEHAYNFVNHIDTNLGDKFSGLAKNAPAAIMANGLGQTLAFWKSKNEPYYTQMVEAVSGWVNQRLSLNISNDQDLLNWVITNANDMEYRLATAEAIEYLIWIKRLASIQFPG